MVRTKKSPMLCLYFLPKVVDVALHPGQTGPRMFTNEPLDGYAKGPVGCAFESAN